MSTHYKTSALVIGRVNRGDSDRIFSVFTDNFGKIDVFAKAIRKINSKLRSGIDTLCHSEIEFIQGKNRKTLTDAVALKRFNNVIVNPKKAKALKKIIESIDSFIKGQELDDKLFELTKNVFYFLDKADPDSTNFSLVYYYFLWNLFLIQGHGSELYKCAFCDSLLNRDNVFFSIRGGGAVCQQCGIKHNDSQKINADTVKVLRIFLKNNLDIISKLKISKEAEIFLEKISEDAMLFYSPS